jgi:predicted  nucleic acid-binding Zn-ribbon protein
VTDNKRYHRLAEELGAIGVQIAQISSKLVTAPDEQLDSLQKQLGKLESKRQALQTALAAIRRGL